LRAVEDQHLTYADLKRMARASLEHSFIPGMGLWEDAVVAGNVSPCKISLRDSGTPNPACKAILEQSERARVQWQLERAFADFEKRF
jgi:adenosine deaminase